MNKDNRGNRGNRDSAPGEILRLAKLARYKEEKSKPCVDCGGSFHMEAMQFDHVNSDKRANVSALAFDYGSVERMLAEIAKCELVCANCHAIRTYNKRRGL